MNNNNDNFYENLFGSDATAKPADSDSENTDSSTERLFDMNAGKTFIGIGDINENIAKGRKAKIGYIVVGSLFMIFGATRESFLFGLILMGIGAFLYYCIYDQIKTKCPQCKRLDGMKVIHSEDLETEEDITRYNVFVNNVHKHDEVKIDRFTTSKEYMQCCYCGYCDTALRKRKDSSDKYENIKKGRY